MFIVSIPISGMLHTKINSSGMLHTGMDSFGMPHTEMDSSGMLHTDMNTIINTVSTADLYTVFSVAINISGMLHDKIFDTVILTESTSDECLKSLYPPLACFTTR